MKKSKAEQYKEAKQNGDLSITDWELDGGYVHSNMYLIVYKVIERVRFWIWINEEWQGWDFKHDGVIGKELAIMKVEDSNLRLTDPKDVPLSLSDKFEYKKYADFIHLIFTI
ncbi:hypothetical protein [Parapedobacter koreensis]|nr:hypothetical protein [Parapedobacter koreensis]